MIDPDRLKEIAARVEEHEKTGFFSGSLRAREDLRDLLSALEASEAARLQAEAERDCCAEASALWRTLYERAEQRVKELEANGELAPDSPAIPGPTDNAFYNLIWGSKR